MAIGTTNDMLVFNEQFYGGFQESVESNLMTFNESVGGAIRLNAQFMKGYFAEEAFFTDTITVRDRTPGDISILTPDSIGSSSVGSVKAFRSIFVEQEMESFRINGFGEAEMAYLIGRRAGDEIIQEWRESVYSALVGSFSTAALASGANQLVADFSQTAGGGVFDVGTLIGSMGLMGDRSARLKTIIMHSAVYWPLLASTATNLATPVSADRAVNSGIPALLGFPIVVVNSPALVDVGGGLDGQDAYYTLILQEGAATLTESEERFVDMDKNLTRANSTMQYKVEFAFNIAIKGMSFNGAVPHPSQAQLATSTNWTKVYDSKYNLGGFMIKSVGVANEEAP